MLVADRQVTRPFNFPANSAVYRDVVSGGIGGCIAGAETGCAPGATAGAFGGLVSGAVLSLSDC